MSNRNGKHSEGDSSSTWTWIGIGIGTGLLITLLAGISYHYLNREDEERDPRAEKVQELILEAERLLAQGRRASS